MGLHKTFHAILEAVAGISNEGAVNAFQHHFSITASVVLQGWLVTLPTSYYLSNRVEGLNSALH